MRTLAAQGLSAMEESLDTEHVADFFENLTSASAASSAVES